MPLCGLRRALPRAKQAPAHACSGEPCHGVGDSILPLPSFDLCPVDRASQAFTAPASVVPWSTHAYTPGQKEPLRAPRSNPPASVVDGRRFDLDSLAPLSTYGLLPRPFLLRPMLHQACSTPGLCAHLWRTEHTRNSAQASRPFLTSFPRVRPPRIMHEHVFSRHSRSDGKRFLGKSVETLRACVRSQLSQRSQVQNTLAPPQACPQTKLA